MKTCPYCLSPILDNEETTECPICGTKHHSECLRENGACAFKDCGKVSKPNAIDIEVDAQPRTMLVLSRESVEEVAPNRIRRKASNPCMECGAQLPEGELYCAKCTPDLGENQDSHNVGPLLIMIGIIALIVAWIAIVTFGPHTAVGPGGDPTSQQQDIHYRH